MVVSPLVETTGLRPLQAVDLGFQTAVAGQLPLSPQPVLQAYIFLNAGRYQRPWVVTPATLGSRFYLRLQECVGEILNACVECHLVVQFLIERNMSLQVSLEFRSVSAPEIRTNRWGLKA